MRACHFKSFCGVGQDLTQEVRQELRKSPPPAASPPALSKIAKNRHDGGMALETEAARSKNRPAAIQVVASDAVAGSGHQMEVPRSSLSSTR